MRSRSFAAFLVLGLYVVLVSAQGPAPAPNPAAPVLKAPGPIGMQPGTTLDLLLTGTNLAGPTGLILSFPATVTIPTDMNNGKDATKLLVKLAVPKEAPLGVHSLRLATGRGMSNVRLFCLDDLPPVAEKAGNNTKMTAQAVPVPSVVVGQIAAESSDYFKVAAKAGERISFDVLARRIGSALDPQITLLDAKTGREVSAGHANDSPGLQTDCRLTHTFKEAGEYLVEIRDVSYRGGEGYDYRLRIGDFPCATTPLPLAIKRGSKATIQFAGPMVEGVKPVEVTAPSDPTIEAIQVTPRGANGLAGWPVSLALSSIDEVVETEPNSEPAKASRVPVPGAITGRLQEKGDRDHLVFTAKKGQRVILEAQTFEYYTPTEVYVVLKDAKGAQLQASNPAAAPRLDFNPPADGDYTLVVEHLHGWGGPDEVYRLSATPYEPGFELSVALDRYDVPATNTFSIPILVNRRDYAEPIEVSVVGPPGLTGKVTIPKGAPAKANQPGGTLTITAAEGLADKPFEFRIVGKATINGKPVESYASVQTPVSASLAALPMPPRELFTRLAVAVTERPPFSLTAKFDQAESAPGKPAPVTITATRLPGFTGEIVISATGQPANVKPALKNIPANMNEVKAQFDLAANAAVGSFPITINGKSKHNNKDFSVNAPAVPLVIKK